MLITQKMKSEYVTLNNIWLQSYFQLLHYTVINLTNFNVLLSTVIL
jgi:hypothetical protein